MNGERFFAIVDNKKFLRGLKDEDVAAAIHVSMNTYHKRKMNPGSFTIREIYSIMKYLEFTKTEMAEALIE